MAARKKKSLVIVESPAKARTINKYLGDAYDVVASKGHVRDLVKSGLGIDIENGWIPKYRVLKDRKEVLEVLKKHAASAGTVYLAPDPDREGEAIAWHLKESLKLDDSRIKRVTFNEITKNAVNKAFASAGDINMDLVAAQEARRFLDRVVGYKLSSLLSRRLADTNLSAGRVQSVALRLIVEREAEIDAFVVEEYWKISALLRPEELRDPKTGKTILVSPAEVSARPRPTKKPPPPKRGRLMRIPRKAPRSPKRRGQGAAAANSFKAELAEWAGKKFEAAGVAQVTPVFDELAKANYVITKVEQKEQQDRPPAPFTTSTLQQQASLRLHFAAKKTMMVASDCTKASSWAAKAPSP